MKLSPKYESISVVALLGTATLVRNTAEQNKPVPDEELA